MFESDQKNKHHYGSDAHRNIDRVVGGAGKILIVSPYIDNYYARKISSSMLGREFYIISSSPDSLARKTLLPKSPYYIVPYALVSILGIALALKYSLFGPIMLAMLLPFGFGVLKYVAHLFSMRKIHLKTPPKFVHAKMYICDDIAVTGSANLTYKGTHSNIEHIETVTNKDEIDDLKNQFWGLWNSF